MSSYQRKSLTDPSDGFRTQAKMCLTSGYLAHCLRRPSPMPRFAPVMRIDDGTRTMFRLQIYQMLLGGKLKFLFGFRKNAKRERS